MDGINCPNLLEVPNVIENLFHFVKNGDSKIYYILEKNLSLVDSQDENGNSLLHWAVFLNNVYLACYLLEKSFEISHKDFNGCTVIDWASYNNNIFFLRLFSIFMNNLYSFNITYPSSALHKAVIGNAYEAVVYLIYKKHQNVFDIATNDKKTILNFIEENRDKVDYRIYEFLTCKKVQKFCKKKNNKQKINTLYEPNGTIGPYTIKKKKKLTVFRKIYYEFIENKWLLLYPLIVILGYLYFNIAYFFYTRMYIYKENHFVDISHLLLFVAYYVVISTNPGYLYDSNLQLSKNKLLANDNTNENKPTHKEIEIKRNCKNKVSEETNKDKVNPIYNNIVQTIEKEIKDYEKETKVIEFVENVKCEKIDTLQKKFFINKNNYFPLFQIKSLDINKLCPSCFLFKTLRTKHCRYCDVCIDIFDHHCVYTLNCMGVDNARMFLSWILFNICFMCYNIYKNISFIFKNCSYNNVNLLFFLSFFTSIISLIYIIFMANILIHSVFNILENITSNENYKMYYSKLFFTYTLKLGKNNEPFVVRTIKNPFDKGAWMNVLNFLTKSKKNLSETKKNTFSWIQMLKVNEYKSL
uniref:Palmitoyltransferase n=1 Tax=Piliocolobus tephrosceles TaxID=591936 RepID=A0A8C9GM21_9PRIM